MQTPGAARQIDFFLKAAWLVRVRKLGLGVLSGILGGMIAGVLARLDMRIIAVTAGMRPIFTLGGSLTPLWMGSVLGAAFGMLFVFFRSLLPLKRFVRLGGGLGFGLILFLAFILPLYLWQPDFKSELNLAPGHLGIALFGSLPFLFGLVVAVIYPALERRLSALIEPSSAALAGYIMLSLLGLGGSGLVLYGIVLAVIEAGR